MKKDLLSRAFSSLLRADEVRRAYVIVIMRFVITGAALIISLEPRCFTPTAVQRQRAHVLVMSHAVAAAFQHDFFPPFRSGNAVCS